MIVVGLFDYDNDNDNDQDSVPGILVTGRDGVCNPVPNVSRPAPIADAAAASNDYGRGECPARPEIDGGSMGDSGR
ncbi:hypothetical protein THSYN_08540 [Candidatus Thiodictyon syntrophicum]|uniref:Uncharacterized protein n=1 Tax=Candidatus Thiodictyon syntrophicum TaxID=1166950 RepID=A0A2K8U7E5_9GAMM|nr:hypothetical protein THSYN_08540 [Candidatus Thiodictyon syntrophicum]